MSNRSMLEINHGRTPRDGELVDWALKIVKYLQSGNPSDLPQGVTWFGMRHHSEKCPMGDPPRGWNNDDDKYQDPDYGFEV